MDRIGIKVLLLGFIMTGLLIGILGLIWSLGIPRGGLEPIIFMSIGFPLLIVSLITLLVIDHRYPDKEN